jgi:aconitate hydratase 2/2-methylisocitrate dehydratase
MKYMGEITTKGAEIYRYLNFNQVAEYQEVADTVKLAA